MGLKRDDIFGHFSEKKIQKSASFLGVFPLLKIQF